LSQSAIAAQTLRVSVLAITYFLIAEAILGIGLYRNFEIHIVLLLLAIFSMPALLLFLGTAYRIQVNPFFATWRSHLKAMALAGFLVFLQVLAVTQWSAFFPNFPNLALSEGRGFVKDGSLLDSAFHASIVQSIQEVGYPSIAQHYEPFVFYHSLSHYADAALGVILGIDVWDSLSLLFFFKTIGLILAIIWFVFKVTLGRGEGAFWVTLSVSFLAITADWQLIGSWGHWFVVMLIFYLGPFVSRIVFADKIGVTELIKLSAIIIFVSLGKVSLGFSLALLSGLVLFFRFPRRPEVIIAGLVWASFFATYGSGFVTILQEDWLARLGALRYVSAPFFTTVGLVLLSFASGRRGNSPDLVRAAIASFAAIILTAIMAILYVNFPPDVFWFFLGLFIASFIVLVPKILEVLVPPRQEMQEHADPNDKTSIYSVAIALSLSPMIAVAPLGPYVSFFKLTEQTIKTNTVSYENFNYSVGASEQQSVWRVLSSGLTTPTVDRPNFFDDLRDALNRLVIEEGIEASQPLLFLSAEDFEYLKNEFSLPYDWGNGLVIRAALGFPLVYSVSDPLPTRFGLESYGSEAYRLSTAEFETITCEAKRPILFIRSMSPIEVGVKCVGSEPG